MARVLLTAFAPFAHWEENSSWLALQSLALEFPESVDITTRRYPVEYASARQQLERDLENPYDYSIHLGQSARASHLEIETIAINVAEIIVDGRRKHQTLCADGPTAYQTGLPADELCDLVNEEGVPCRVSHHAGTYLCNATFYWSQYLSEQLGLKMQSVFIHLPLAPQQLGDVRDGEQTGQPLAPDQSAFALRSILKRLAQPQQLA